MDIKDFYYDLPENLIAQVPLLDRSSSRLMLVDRESGEIKNTVFTEIENLLKEGDCLVINDTKVIPARLIGSIENTNKEAEILLLKRLCENKFECLVRPGKKLRVGARVNFGLDGILKASIEEVKEDGNRIVKFEFKGIFEEILDKLGQMPLPPYIKEKLEDKDRYQTVYAKHSGSAAAPTAGLHFNKELLARLEKKGVEIARVTLHVGLGTFRPVKEKDITKHYMHSEYYEINEEACKKINRAKENKKRVICVGTTSCRVLESVANERGEVVPKKDETSIFIYPGYKFKLMDGLITNFHLPESTLLMLVSAFSSRDNIIRAYEEAVKEKYRFFSFGDAMFIN